MNDFEKLISVIIPVHNMEGRLDKLSEVIERCSNDNFEIIIIFDNCTDKTVKECYEIFRKASKNENIKFFEVDFGNPGQTRNFGIDKANGEWILFWDSDDSPKPDIYLSLIKNAQKDVEVIVGQYIAVDALSNQKIEESNDRKIIDVAFNPGIWRMMFKRNIVPQNAFSHLSLAEDHNFLANINLPQRNIVFSDLLIYEYSINVESQLTQSQSNLHDLILAAINTIYYLKLHPSSFNRILFWREIITFYIRSRGYSRRNGLREIRIELKALNSLEKLLLLSAFPLVLILKMRKLTKK